MASPNFTLVSKECSFTICGFAISFGSLSVQVNGTSTSVLVYANTSNTPETNSQIQLGDKTIQNEDEERKEHKEESKSGSIQGSSKHGK